MGFIGGVIGYFAGSVIAYFLGPSIAGINVMPMPILLIWSILLALSISLIGSILPAYFASRFEPYSNMQDV